MAHSFIEILDDYEDIGQQDAVILIPYNQYTDWLRHDF